MKFYWHRPLFHITAIRQLSRNFLHIDTTHFAFMDEVPSLKIGAKKLGQVTELSVPAALAQPLLTIKKAKTIDDASTREADAAALWQRGAPIPTAFGPLLHTRVVRNACVTRTTAGRIGKPKWELELELVADGVDDYFAGDTDARRELLANCDAGDSFNVLFDNPAAEVRFVLQRLGFSVETAEAEQALEVLSSPSEKINGKFAYLPPRCSPRQLVSQFVDIRRAPSRLALRAFADHASCSTERRRLLELCSMQGATEFVQFVRQPNISLVELLCVFPSLAPPLECLIGYLPRLMPRHYTLACHLPCSLPSPSSSPNNNDNIRFRFVYSVLEQPASTLLDTHPEFIGQKRYGACTQWLLELRPGQTVQLVQKEPSKFRLLPPSLARRVTAAAAPAELSDAAADHLLLNTPLMMVGPGTGVAPFIAFLQKIRHCIQRMDDCGAGVGVRRTLFYASSNLEDEFLFRSELHQMVADGVLSELVLCESRPPAVDDNAAPARPARVYDALRQRSAEVAHFLTADSEDDGGGAAGLFYACGDVKNMSRELWTCLRDILQCEKGFSSVEAIELLKKLREKERLIEDVWS